MGLIHSFSQQLLNTSHNPGTVVDTGNRAVNKTDQDFARFKIVVR
jgi:hypothetical protein